MSGKDHDPRIGRDLSIINPVEWKTGQYVGFEAGRPLLWPKRRG